MAIFLSAALGLTKCRSLVAIALGLVVGTLMSVITEYYTSMGKDL